MSRHHHHRRDPTLGAFLCLALVLGCFFTYPLASFGVLALGAGVVCTVTSRQRAAEVKRKRAWEQQQWALDLQNWEAMRRPTPGADWCDLCAEWTVHETAQHAA